MDLDTFLSLHGAVIIGTLLVGVPPAAAASWFLATYRTRLGRPAPWRTALCDVGVVVGTVPWYVMAWRSEPDRPGSDGLSLVPFRDLIATLGDESVLYVVVQIGGNLLVFATLGALLPIRSRWFASPFAGWPVRVAAVACAGSLLIETVQYAAQLGRAASIDDVLLNTTGAMLAAALTRPWWPPLSPK